MMKETEMKTPCVPDILDVWSLMTELCRQAQCGYLPFFEKNRQEAAPRQHVSRCSSEGDEGWTTEQGATHLTSGFSR